MRPEKQTIVAELKQKLQGTPYVILTDFTGLDVEGFTQLRERLAKVNARAMVVKNSLLRLTLKELKMPDLNGTLQGPTAVVFGTGEVTAAAGVLKKFFKEFEKPRIKAGLMDGAILDVDQINMLADLPSREALRAQLLSLFLAPASQLVRLFNTPAGGLVQVLKAKSEKAENPDAPVPS